MLERPAVPTFMLLALAAVAAVGVYGACCLHLRGPLVRR